MTVSEAQKKASKKYFDTNYKQVKLSMPNILVLLYILSNFFIYILDKMRIEIILVLIYN